MRPGGLETTAPMLRRLAPWLAGALLTVGALTGARAESVVLYTASNAEIEKAILAAFSKAHPDIQVNSVNISTGPVVQRVIAEKANPQADVVWMVNNIALDQIKAAGAFEPYEPTDAKVPDDFRDPDGFWTAHNATVMAMAVNVRLLKEKGLPVPASWEDLAKPVYKGMVSVASASKSGTGLSIMATLYDAYGWDYLDRLNANVFQYQSSGSSPVRQAATGEVAIGLSYDTAIIQAVRAGQPVEIVYGGLSPNILEGAGLVARAPHPKAGKVFLDFLFSEAAGPVWKPYVGIGASPGVTNVDLTQVKMWQMKKPLNADQFKRDWSARYDK